MKIITRFAPSPTGNVHIGNIRVAIYNWLFAKHNHGNFLLRIEDTDKDRSTDDAINNLFTTLQWLNLNYDEEPLYQSKQESKHVEVAEYLLSKGCAYKENKDNKGECIIFKMPNDDISFNDGIKGRLKKPIGDIDDFVLVRSNGKPVFHLANVVDDIEQKITHIIRGDDHIENTYKHIALYRALNADIPSFSHLPMIVNSQGKPFSKRDGDAYVSDFKKRGYLPQAFVNYLVLLGWSPGNDQEIMSIDEMINMFTIERCQSSPAQFDEKKMKWMNGEYLSKISNESFNKEAFKIITSLHSSASENLVKKVIALIRDRVKVFEDIEKLVNYFFVDNIEYDEKLIAKKIKKEGIKELFNYFTLEISKIDSIDEVSLKKIIDDYIKETGKSYGEVMIPLRIAVSGASGGPDLIGVLSTLGKPTIIERINDVKQKYLD
ncbi:MAG: glutamate--tRNA ligase [Kiritimatiellaceae bacterium]|nr:glutamate--tRNA ligase [Kiritimatiellaceae bacterium]|tara:strand:+ start:87 stop:1388 length:1302 start_codon:yes stop_codon:yes gene_type:complete